MAATNAVFVPCTDHENNQTTPKFDPAGTKWLQTDERNTKGIRGPRGGTMIVGEENDRFKRLKGLRNINGIKGLKRAKRSQDLKKCKGSKGCKGRGAEPLLRRNMKQFQGGLVSKAHRLVYHSTLGLRVINKK